MTRSCAECGRAAGKLRRDRCDACYMRLYRNGEVETRASCAACGDRRRELLAHTKLQGRVVLCGNCARILERTRPPLATVDDLRRRVRRERRSGDDRRRAVRPEPGRRLADRIPPPPQLDPSID